MLRNSFIYKIFHIRISGTIDANKFIFVLRNFSLDYVYDIFEEHKKLSICLRKIKFIGQFS